MRDEIILTNEEYKMFSEICASELPEMKMEKENSGNMKLIFDNEDLLEKVVEKIEDADIAEEPFLRSYMSHRALLIEKLVIKFHDL